MNLGGYSFLIAFVFYAIVGQVVLGQDVTVEKSDGTELKSELQKIENDQIYFSKIESLPIDQVNRLVFQSAAKPQTDARFRVICRTGTIVHAHRVTLKDQAFQLLTRRDELLATLPRSTLERVEFHEGATQEQWDALNAEKITGDGLVVLRGGKLDVVEGVILSLNVDQVEFKTPDRIATVQLSKLVGLVFFQSTPKLVPQGVVLTDRFGNSYRGQTIRIENQAAQLSVKGNPSLTIPVAKIAAVDFSQGKFVYLDSLTPQSVQWRPFFQSKVRDPEVSALLKAAQSQKVVWTRNESFGDPLRFDLKKRRTAENPVGRVTFDRGVSIKGGTKLIFEIPNGARYFSAQSGIQASRHGLGAISMQFLCDGQLIQTVKISAQDSDLTDIKFPVKGSRLTLNVDYGDQQDFGDIVTLGNARFLKK